MDTKAIFGFTLGVVCGVVGTLAVDYFLRKRDEAAWGVEPEDHISINPVEGISRDERRISSFAEEKPELGDRAHYNKYFKDDESAQGAKPPISIFDHAEPAEVSEDPEVAKLDMIPPKYRDHKPTYYDILEIDRDHYLTETMGYTKQTCTYYLEDDILAGGEDQLVVLDAGSTVGHDIIDIFKEDETIDVLFVSNVTTKTDYEILRSFDIYEELVELESKSDEDDYEESWTIVED